MIPPPDSHTLCWFCKQREATHAYANPRFPGSVCSICLRRLALQDALEEKLVLLATLRMEGRYDEALLCLSALLDANRERDEEQWLARAVARNRAAILLAAERVEEARLACEQWAALGFGDVWERWMHASAAAQTLDALGLPQDALDVLEDALQYRDPKELPTARSLLMLLVELSEKLGKPVDERWRSLANAIAQRYRLAQLPEASTLGEAIVKLCETTRDLQPKPPAEWALELDDVDPSRAP